MNWLQLLATGLLLCLLQVAAALPWTIALGWEQIRVWKAVPKKQRSFADLLALPIVWALLGILFGGLATIPVLQFTSDPDNLYYWGRIYGAVLHLQLALDAVVLPLALLLAVWPKGGAVALAAFREGIRQPMFWLIGIALLVMMAFSTIIPYFTLGEDYIMVKQLGYDFIMLAALLFGVLAASMSISDEIEGRTAITLLSKPVSRRQFLIGKYAGILLAVVGMTGVLGWFFQWVLLLQRVVDRIDRHPLTPVPPSLMETLQAWAATPETFDFFRGVAQWTVETGDVMPGLVLHFCQVVVMLAIATALATRLPLVVNLVSCLFVYSLGHLTPVLVQIARRRQETDPTGSPVAQLLTFMARVFDTVVPTLDLFRVDAALLSDAPPPLGQFFFYIAQASVLALLYAIIALLIGLVLFEDRDLA